MHPGQLEVPVATVNALLRIGDGLAARFPLQPEEVGAARQQREREVAAAADLAGRTPFRHPRAPKATGLVRYHRDSNPVMSLTGRRTIDRLLADADLTSGGCPVVP